ncbi:hypothetical protein PTSG_00583 [Salpingoeca rosetta]|uniref:BRO1 domain-containing protein n=1 Tax=Salpingoeca rosetta (strain ATCC 50818 / BSB-021) TaxID=946362 RepID=F2TWW3_SALR5|nr:uncharacterized protein PTSG_00583 [Salpingoeca rosetta]EGD72559.1 hypothetical protein PTSG_00583 [Salpingoeca rosetta]|eukprot:XP_004999128.1 hypothetical protein PTSG_00583 [Salpingoeca rosetta]
MPVHGSMAFVSVNPKKAQHVSFVEPLAKFVSREYQQDPATLKEPVKELSELRDSCIVKAPEKHDSGLKAVMKYYGRLTALTRRFPFKTSEPWDGILPSPIVLKFSWEDSQASSVFGGKKIVALEDINFEMINVLYNMGAVHSQIGAMANISSDAGLKHASVNFQSAAVCFKNVAAQVHKYYTKPPSSDLQPMFLNALSFLMLAQSQEMYWRKCVVERKSNGTIAKLAKQTSSFYADAYRNLVASGVADKTWLAATQAKTAYYEADAQYRIAMADKAEEEMGSAIARLRIAEAKLAEAAHQAAGTDFNTSHLQQTVSSLIKEYEKENGMIYMKVVPAASALPPLDQHATVSADRELPDFTAKEYMGDDPFAAIMPLSVHQGAQRYAEKRDEFIREQIEAINKSTNECVEGLTEMQLPGALQAVQNPTDIPQALVAHCEEIRAAGGTAPLNDLIAALPEKSKMCREMLDETRERLEQEEKADTELRQKYGSRWSREPSAKLNANMRKEIDKYTRIIDNATQSDQTVVHRFHEIEPAIQFMAGPIEEVKAALPTSSGDASGPAAPMEELTQLLTRLDELRDLRDAMSAKFEQLKETDDITHLLLEKGSSTDEATLFDEQLKHYTNAVEEAQQLVQETTDVMARTREANDRFRASKSAGGAEREAMLNDLAAKYEAWKTLSRDLQEGSKFYEQLIGLLSKQQAKCTDFCVARDFEKQDLQSSITRDIASVPSEDYSTPPGSSSSAPTATATSTATPQPQPSSSYPSVPQPRTQQAPPQPAYGYQPPPQQYVPPSANQSYQGYASAPSSSSSSSYMPPYQQPPQQQHGGYMQPPPQGGYQPPYGQQPQMPPYQGAPPPMQQQQHPPYGQPPQAAYGQPPYNPQAGPYGNTSQYGAYPGHYR